MLLIESEKEKARSDAEAMKQLFCQEMRIEYDEKVWIRGSRLRVAECWRSASPFPRLSAARGGAIAGKAGGAQQECIGAVLKWIFVMRVNSSRSAEHEVVREACQRCSAAHFGYDEVGAFITTQL